MSGPDEEEAMRRRGVTEDRMGNELIFDCCQFSSGAACLTIPHGLDRSERQGGHRRRPMMVRTRESFALLRPLLSFVESFATFISIRWRSAAAVRKLTSKKEITSGSYRHAPRLKKINSGRTKHTMHRGRTTRRTWNISAKRTSASRRWTWSEMPSEPDNITLENDDEEIEVANHNARKDVEILTC